MNSKPRNKLEKVNILLELALNTKATLKYRNLFNIEEDKKIINQHLCANNDLIEKLSLKNITYNSSELKGLDDKDNPLRKINHQCDLLKKFLNSHSGFDRENLQNYLNLYCFIYNCRKNRLEKVEEFLKLALNKKVSLKYRDLFDAKE